MKYKLAHFLEWFSINEHSINELPRLQSEKKLFWLHWIQWHLDFYIPGTYFFLLFSQKQGSSELCLFRNHAFPDYPQHSKIAPSIFSLRFACRMPSAKPLECFEEQIILDMERKQKKPWQAQRPTFAQLSFPGMLLYCAYKQLPDALEILGKETGSIVPNISSEIFVRRSQLTIQENVSMAYLIAFDHYMDILNGENR